MPVKRIEGEVALFCVNPSCPAKLVRAIEHFVSRATLDIAGLGVKIVEQLVNEGLITDPADLYSLKVEDLIDLEGFGEKKAENIVAAIQASKSQPLSRLIFALGIKGVGEVVSEQLANEYRSLDRLQTVTEDELTSLEGIGPNIALEIVNWFSSPDNREVLAKLKALGMWPEAEAVDAGGTARTLEGKTLVITGMMEGMGRNEMKALIQSRGGKVTSAVSSKTDYLVAGENAGSKLSKAEALGIQILSQADLEDLIGDE
jgi:DNA ligase (NAD+)